VRLLKLFEEFPFAEPSIFHRISKQMKPDDTLYVGNSLPIREWDLAARRDVSFYNCFGNRGANGIDGQLSTFFGWGKRNVANWAIIGDLTMMYDLSAPWALRSRPLSDVRIVAINNGGGRIFQPMFHEPLFENSHTMSFSNWAKMWSLPYQLWNGMGSITTGVTEIVPDDQQTKAFRGMW
jgi:2-succinyl-5-enolpyruvyl-6-hydroxy-3-cyclohexene-1-carboxylate synthase